MPEQLPSPPPQQEHSAPSSTGTTGTSGSGQELWEKSVGLTGVADGTDDLLHGTKPHTIDENGMLEGTNGKACTKLGCHNVMFPNAEGKYDVAMQGPEGKKRAPRLRIIVGIVLVYLDSENTARSIRFV